LRKFFEIIEYEIDNFHSSMWNENAQKYAQDFLSSPNTEKVYIWVQESKLIYSVDFPSLS